MTTPHPTPEERVEAALNDWRKDAGDLRVHFARAIREAEAAGEARGRAAHLSIISEWLDVGMLKLRAGELSAQEIRTVIAVLTAIAAAVRARTNKENSDD